MLVLRESSYWSRNEKIDSLTYLGTNLKLAISVSLLKMVVI